MRGALIRLFRLVRLGSPTLVVRLPGGLLVRMAIPYFTRFRRGQGQGDGHDRRRTLLFVPLVKPLHLVFSPTECLALRG